jgi:haloacetate dehalogenase
MFAGFAKNVAQVGDVEIAYRMAGAGPPVLLLHGFPQSMAMWAHIAPLLAANYSVVCSDLRGYGDSSKPDCLPDNSNYSFRQMATDQIGLMRQLGFQRFHLIGHDRGGRTGHRMALDHPDALLSLSVLDIVPTYAMLMDTNRRVAGSYWHWYFLSQPLPFPEHMIGLDPDFFYETCLVGWGATRLEDFDREQLEEYRRAWRDRAMIHGSCSDYRAAVTIDLEHDEADLRQRVTCPSLVFHGAQGQMAKLFDIPGEWRKRLENIQEASLPGGHFFPDQFPAETAETLLEFLDRIVR